ncbi:Protein of unknown function, partial [Gryllus bimaculatus]
MSGQKGSLPLSVQTMAAVEALRRLQAQRPQAQGIPAACSVADVQIGEDSYRLSLLLESCSIADKNNPPKKPPPKKKTAPSEKNVIRDKCSYTECFKRTLLFVFHVLRVKQLFLVPTLLHRVLVGAHKRTCAYPVAAPVVSMREVARPTTSRWRTGFERTALQVEHRRPPPPPML